MWSGAQLIGYIHPDTLAQLAFPMTPYREVPCTACIARILISTPSVLRDWCLFSPLHLPQNINLQ